MNTTIRPLTEAEIERFWSHVDKTGTCWVWLGARTKAAGFEYGVMQRDGKMIRPHRVAFQLAGRILKLGMTIDHTCENKLCCNPDHLEQITQSENTRRGYERHPERLRTMEEKREDNRRRQKEWRDGNPTRWTEIRRASDLRRKTKS